MKDFSFRTVLKVHVALDDNDLDLAMEILDCDSLHEFQELVSWLGRERWESESNSWKDLLTEEEKAEVNRNKNNKNFDFCMDFDAYYCDFIEYFNINLLKEDLDWFTFNWLLMSVINKDDSELAKRISYRNYKPKKEDGAQHRDYMLKQKRKYAFEISNNDEMLYESFKVGETIG